MGQEEEQQEEGQQQEGRQEEQGHVQRAAGRVWRRGPAGRRRQEGQAGERQGEDGRGRGGLRGGGGVPLSRRKSKSDAGECVELLPAGRRGGRRRAVQANVRSGLDWTFIFMCYP